MVVKNTQQRKYSDVLRSMIISLAVYRSLPVNLASLLLCEVRVADAYADSEANRCPYWCPCRSVYWF